MPRWILPLLTLFALLATVQAEEAIDFNRDVRSILSQNCYRCHGQDAKRREGKLRLDQEAGVQKAFAVGDLAKNKAWQRITSSDPDEQMPPPDSRLRLTEKEKQTLQRWITQGAKWQGHWSFQPITRPAVPATPRKTHPIDAFVNAQLKNAGIKALPRADAGTLTRRVSLDLIGLPPTPGLLTKYRADSLEKSYGKLVDELLASPQYGERMALYWLDLVRYADSVGYHKDSHRDCWLYRDYIIRAFNDNKSYDRFVLEQLAGDLLPGEKLDQYEWKIASGLNRMNQTTSEGGAQAKEYLAKYSSDRVRNTAAIFLGVTLGCAECHDHKYDPFTANDFYNFAAFFGDLQERGVGYPQSTMMPTAEQVQTLRDLHRQKAELQATLADAKGDHVAAKTKLSAVEQKIKLASNTRKWHRTLITVAGKPRTIRFLPRGNWLDDSGPIAQPAVPAFLRKLNAKDRRATRVDLANWITHSENPLTARAFVNRLWALFFGEGLTRTLDDLGAQGQSPTHPELLDWLAAEFIESGWDVKRLVRLIVTSETYQRSSACPAPLRKRDPENHLLARQASFRLPAETVRDNALAISGLLSAKMYGRSVRPYQPANYWYRLYRGGRYVQDHKEDLYRRGVYTYWRRSFWHPSLRAFDAPAREECVAKRPRSNTPAQSLVLLNDPTYVEAARQLATLMIQQGGDQPEQRIAWAYLRAVARRPNPAEIQLLVELQKSQLKRYQEDLDGAKKLLGVGEKPIAKELDPVELASWTSIARVLLNLHETITRD